MNGSACVRRCRELGIEGCELTYSFTQAPVTRTASSSAAESTRWEHGEEASSTRRGGVDECEEDLSGAGTSSSIPVKTPRFLGETISQRNDDALDLLFRVDLTPQPRGVSRERINRYDAEKVGDESLPARTPFRGVGPVDAMNQLCEVDRGQGRFLIVGGLQHLAGATVQPSRRVVPPR